MDKFIGMYFSNSYISDKNKLANYLLYYDELHFGMPGAFDVDNWISKENINKSFSIGIIGKNPKGDEQEDLINVKNLKNLVLFVKNNHNLINNCLFFHKEVVGKYADDMAHKLLNGGLELNKLISILTREEDDDIDTFFKYVKTYSSDPPAIAHTKATALLEAEKNNYNLIFEKKNEINKFWGRVSLANDLSSILAFNALNLVVPLIKINSPEDIVEIREKLKEQLIPFRMSMRKLSKELKAVSKDCHDAKILHEEAKFIIETQVEPAMEELKRRIKMEDNKFFTRLFGKVISWVPFIANIYLTPTPEKFFNLIKKVGSDTGDLFNEINNDPLILEPGIGYLLGVEKFGID